MVVTNVPGPQSPAYLLGAEMVASYPLVPLFSNQALGIALFSYNGGLFWGFNADWDAVPDLHELVEFVEAEFAQLVALAESVPATIPHAAEGNGAAVATPATESHASSNGVSTSAA